VLRCTCPDDILILVVLISLMVWELLSKSRYFCVTPRMYIGYVRVQSPAVFAKTLKTACFRNTLVAARYLTVINTADNKTQRTLTRGFDFRA